ncbi:protein SENESCENCE-ASSOCIATED GENE 21, mitochondrial [Oryza brachyantha]|uniref:protein SENESCENCE-ASSOCIATED GENE 21, mitochondrial n=1 Tax=Oryza brachyantha TaxID=4533 RepID=UPI001ADB8766|nr:protein SENESCENCE-ASSOCIATED GENE 21, mitochondrial [Oryza brachyantha]
MERVASSCLSLLAQRRGYSVAAAVVKGAGRRPDEKKAAAAAAATKRTMAKAAEEKTAAWVPDPVTGYYRPAGGAKEVDAAELRAKLLSQRMVAN